MSGRIRKVLLFFPSYRSIEAAPPLALLALAPVAEQRGLQVDIVDSTVEPDYLNRIVGQLDDALCVGISIVTGPMIVEAIQLARAVKAARPGVPVIFGGWHPSTLAEQTLQAPYVDIVVGRQGEATFGEICDRLLEGSDLDGVRGCAFKRSDGTIAHNAPRPTIPISELPPKAYHLIDLEPYARLSGKRWMYYTTSHGCPYDCGFCSNASIYGRAWNALPADRVVEEATDLVRRFRLDLLDIVDDNFMVDRARAIDIGRGFLASGLRFEWCIQTTANFLLRSSDDEVRMLRDSGLARVFIGAESGSDDVLRSVNKSRFQGTSVLHAVAQKCARAGVTCTFSLIFALPDETDEDRRATLAMVRDIKRQFPSTEFHSNIYTPYPGAPNFQRALALGLREPQTLEEWADFYPKFQRLPWLDGPLHDRIQRIREYIRIGYGAEPIRRRSSAKALAHRILGPIARERLRRNAFALPVELWSLRAAARARRAVGFGVRSHVAPS